MIYCRDCITQPLSDGLCRKCGYCVPYPNAEDIRAYIAKTPSGYANRIACIKQLRARTGIGLTEAKDIVEAWCADPNRYWFAACANCNMVLDDHGPNFKCLFEPSLYEPRLLVRE